MLTISVQKKISIIRSISADKEGPSYSDSSTDFIKRTKPKMTTWAEGAITSVIGV